MNLNRRRSLVSAGLLVLAAGLSFLLWGGRVLVVSEPLPPRSDAVVVLGGSLNGDRVRRQEAVGLLRTGRADHLMLSVPEASFLGQRLPEVRQRYLEAVYGRETARRVVLCPHGASSTRDEARALLPCLEREGWRTVVIVSSNYHTRRVRHVWREVTAEARSPLRLAVHAAPDGAFDPDGWWLRRRSARTMLLESAKLAGTWLFQ